jgi:electron transfer flavoprotein alpha/beta subunit
MDSYSCSLVLSDFIREVAPDLVLCGDVNRDFESGQVSPILAEFLDFPFVSRAIGLTMIAGQTTIEVERKLTRGNRQKLRVTLPGVVSVDPSANQPRYISVHCRIRENRAKCVTTILIDRQEFESRVNKPLNLVSITNIGPVRLRPKKVATPDSKMSAQDRLAFLMGGGNKKSSNVDKELVEGNVKTLSDKILEFLKKTLPDYNVRPR